MSTLALDSATWDICADADGNWTVSTDCEAVTQNIRAGLQTCRGEWFLDTTLGLPFDVVTGPQPNLDLYEAEVKSVILGVAGVDRLTSFNLTRENATRRVVTSFQGVTDCGDDFGASV